MHRVGYLIFLVLFGACLRMSQEEEQKNLIETPTVDVDMSPFFQAGNWPKETWWELFQSEELNQMMQEAILKNPTIQSVKETIEQAKQRASIAKSKLYPLVFFDAEGTWSLISKQGIERAYNPNFPKQAKIIDLTLSFNYEFDFWDKNRNLYRAALSLEKAQIAELSQTELIISTALARTYFALKTNLAKQQIYQELYDIRKELAELRHLLLDAAIDDLRIVLLADAEKEKAQNFLYTIEEEIAIDRHLLNIFMGKGPDEAIDIEESLSDLPPPLTIPDNLSLNLISRRPDLMAQIWRLESLAADVGAARADFFPNINLASIAGLSSTIYNLLFHPSSFEGNINPSFKLPVYTAGEIQANLDAKRAAYQEAVFLYNDMILKSAEEVADALVYARAVYSKKQEQDLIVLQEEMRLTLTEARLRAGLDTALEMLAQKEALLQQKLEDLDLAYGRYTAAIALIKAMGGGYDEKL